MWRGALHIELVVEFLNGICGGIASRVFEFIQAGNHTSSPWHTCCDRSSRQTRVTEYQSPHVHISGLAARRALPVSLADYCRARMRLISASLSLITSPLTSNDTLWIVPVNSKGVL